MSAQRFVSPNIGIMGNEVNAVGKEGSDDEDSDVFGGVDLAGYEDGDDKLIEIAMQEDAKDDQEQPEEVDLEAGNEEIRPPRFMRKPGEPSQKERLAHDCTHIHFRSWCKYCMMGRGQHDHHFSHKQKKGKKRKKVHGKVDIEKEDEDGAVASSEDEGDARFPLISLDYCFMGSRRLAANRVPVLIAREEKTKWIMGYYVRNKGPVD